MGKGELNLKKQTSGGTQRVRQHLWDEMDRRRLGSRPFFKLAKSEEWGLDLKYLHFYHHMYGLTHELMQQFVLYSIFQHLQCRASSELNLLSFGYIYYFYNLLYIANGHKNEQKFWLEIPHIIDVYVESVVIVFLGAVSTLGIPHEFLFKQYISLNPSLFSL